MLGWRNVQPFLEQAEGDDEEQAAAALDALANMPLDEEARRLVEEILVTRIDRRTSDPQARAQLLWIGARIDSRPVLAKIHRLRDAPDDPLHPVAVRILAHRGDPEAVRLLVDTLVERLLTEPSAGDAERIAHFDPETLGEDGLTRLNRVRTDDFDVRFWLAIAQARAGEGDPLIGALVRMERHDELPEVLWGNPWSAERRLAAARPLAPAVVEVLRGLAELDVRHDVRKVCWWLTGDRDAEGHEVVRPVPRKPGETSSPSGETATIDAALDELDRATVETYGNEVIDIVKALPSDTPVPTERLLEVVTKGRGLSERQVAWILGRRGLDTAIPELSDLLAATDDPARRRELTQMTEMVTRSVGTGPPYEGSGPDEASGRGFDPISDDDAWKLAGPSMPDEDRAAEAATPEAGTPRSAWPHLHAPEEVRIEVPFQLEVGLRRDPAPGVAVSGPVDLPPGPVEVSVSLMAHGFDFEQPPEITLEVTARDPYPVKELTLTARADPELARERRIFAVYSVGAASRAVAERKVRVVVDDEEAPGAESRETAEGGEPPGSPPPSDPGLSLREPPPEMEADLTIAIARGNDAARVGLVWSLPAASIRLPPPPEDEKERTSSIGSRPEEFLRKIVKKGSETADPFDLYLWLEGTGRTIAQKIPTFVRKAIAAVVAARAPAPATLLIKSEEPHVPWELAILDELGDQTGADGETPPFLGARAQVGRWPLSAPPPPADPPKNVAVERAVAVSGVYEGVPGWTRLPHAEKEAPEVISLCGGGEALEPNFRTVVSSLRGNPAGQVLHFALHGRFDRDGARSGLVLLAPDPRTAGEVIEKFLQSQHVRGVRMKHRPFVFLNACQVGAGEELLGDYGGLAADFVFAGASAVVAPLWSVHDEVAHEFALDFYRRSLDGERLPPAEILRRRRAELTPARVGELATGDGKLSLLAYQLYGHPKYTMNRAAASAGLASKEP